MNRLEKRLKRLEEERQAKPMTWREFIEMREDPPGWEEFIAESEEDHGEDGNEDQAAGREE